MIWCDFVQVERLAFLLEMFWTQIKWAQELIAIKIPEEGTGSKLVDKAVDASIFTTFLDQEIDKELGEKE